MPGLFAQPHDESSAFFNKQGIVPITGHGSNIYQRAPPCPRPTWTAYGTNEPQWTPRQPPPLNWASSPYARVPLPVVGHSTIACHPLLAGRDALEWAIEQHPSKALPRLRESLSGPIAFWQDDRAFFCSTPGMKLNIWIPGVDIPAILDVDTAKIHDVLLTIYNAARYSATRSLCMSNNMHFEIPNVPNLSVLFSMETPASCSRDDEVCCHIRGMMQFKTRWKGLSQSRDDTLQWTLHTAGNG